MTFKEIVDQLPTSMKPALMKLSAEQQASFVAGYESKSRSKVLIAVLAVVFPIQLFFLNQIGLAIAFFLTGGGFGLWYLFEIYYSIFVRLPKYNEAVAQSLLQELKAS
ncbi:MAG: TM2 domain-containing protein [Vampirovibrio sp.]|jgi:hypothetical protein|nr:TM2 domain-containing protein [Vampirovibrio sp.]